MHRKLPGLSRNFAILLWNGQAAARDALLVKRVHLCELDRCVFGTAAVLQARPELNSSSVWKELRNEFYCRFEKGRHPLLLSPTMQLFLMHLLFLFLKGKWLSCSGARIPRRWPDLILFPLAPCLLHVLHPNDYRLVALTWSWWSWSDVCWLTVSLSQVLCLAPCRLPTEPTAPQRMS